MKRDWGIFLLIGAVAVSAVIFVGFIIRSPERTATLSDGSVIRLQRITYGRIHTPTALPSWSELKGMFARKQWSRSSAYSPEFDTMVAWISNAGPRTANPVRISDHRLKVSDALVIKPGLTYRIVPGFSRRKREISLDVDEVISNTPITVASWKVRNPAPRDFARWTAAALPQTNSLDDFKVKLPALRVEHTGPSTFHGPWGEINSARLAARTLKGDYKLIFTSLADENFQDPVVLPVRFTLSDGTGNSVSSIGGLHEFSFPINTLDASEAVWRLRIEFTQTENFRSNQLFSVTFPGSSQTNQASLKLSKNFGNSVMRVIGPKETAKGRGFIITLTHPDEMIVVVRQSPSTYAGSWDHGPTIDLSKGEGFWGQSLSAQTVTFSITRPYVSDFYFKPSDVVDSQ